MDAVPGNYRVIQSLVAERQFELVSTGKWGQAPARQQALEEVGSSLNPPMKARELEYWLGECLRAAYVGEQPKAIAVRKVKPSEARLNFFNKYREWCLANSYVASDKELAHWTGKHASSFCRARLALEEVGFRFERQNNRRGWKVTRRVEPGRTYTEQEVKAMMDKYADELLKKLGKE